MPFYNPKTVRRPLVPRQEPPSMPPVLQVGLLDRNGWCRINPCWWFVSMLLLSVNSTKLSMIKHSMILHGTDVRDTGLICYKITSLFSMFLSGISDPKTLSFELLSKKNQSTVVTSSSVEAHNSVVQRAKTSKHVAIFYMWFLLYHLLCVPRHKLASSTAWREDQKLTWICNIRKRLMTARHLMWR